HGALVDDIAGIERGLGLEEEDVDFLGQGERTVLRGRPALGEAGELLREIHHVHITPPGPAQNASVSRAASSTRATSGTFAFSRAKPGKGTSYAGTRGGGASPGRKAPPLR